MPALVRRVRIPPGWALAIGLLLFTLVRLLVAARMPLSADEAYYRVWAHALAPGYLDHPPMVALWIRAATALAGDTPLGIRLFAPIAALLGSLLLVSAGRDLAPGSQAGTRAAWLLNGTVLLNAGAVTMTPDTPLLLFWTAALASLARLHRTGAPAWWYAAGIATGLAFTSKYTGLLLAPAILAWVVCVPEMRPWLRRRQPYIAAILALAVASPVLLWNASHHWASLLKQGGRTGAWHPAIMLRTLPELLVGQILFATPLLFALFAVGLWCCVHRGAWRRPQTGLLAALALVPLAVFLQHAMGDRVQANWPAVIYPAAALAAGLTTTRLWRTATAVGLACSAAIFLQAATAGLPLPRRFDFTLIRLGGWNSLAAAADVARQSVHADCLVADDYALAAELAFYMQAPVIAAEPRWAYFNLPPAPPACHTALLVRSARRTDRLPRAWGPATPAGDIDRGRNGVTAETYHLWRIAPPAGAVLLPAKEGKEGLLF